MTEQRGSKSILLCQHLMSNISSRLCRNAAPYSSPMSQNTQTFQLGFLALAFLCILLYWSLIICAQRQQQILNTIKGRKVTDDEIWVQCIYWFFKITVTSNFFGSLKSWNLPFPCLNIQLNWNLGIHTQQGWRVGKLLLLVNNPL